jgi:hypothetical protein
VGIHSGSAYHSRDFLVLFWNAAAVARASHHGTVLIKIGIVQLERSWFSNPKRGKSVIADLLLWNCSSKHNLQCFFSAVKRFCKPFEIL